MIQTAHGCCLSNDNRIELHKPVQQEKKTLVSCTYMYVVCNIDNVFVEVHAVHSMHADRQTIPDRFGRLPENAYKLQSVEVLQQ